MDKVPASIFILALLVKLIFPVSAFAPEILLIAPKLPNPAPVIIMGSGLVILFCTCKEALLYTVVFPELVPKPLLF